MKKAILLLLAALPAVLFAAMESQPNQQPARWNTPGAGNPFIPGYFADPTIRKFGDT